MPVTKLNHPLAQHLLTKLRNKNTDRAQFRNYSQRLATMLLIEASRHLQLNKITVTTPIATTTGYELAESIVIVPIMRAGLDFIQPAIDLFPEAHIGFIGIARDEQTALPAEYYYKMPAKIENQVHFIVDPMCATGGSIIHTVNSLKAENRENIIIVTILAAPESIAAIQNKFPEISIVTAQIDNNLNEKKYICPGLGDYGDRLYG